MHSFYLCRMQCNQNVTLLTITSMAAENIVGYEGIKRFVK